MFPVDNKISFLNNNFNKNKVAMRHERIVFKGQDTNTTENVQHSRTIPDIIYKFFQELPKYDLHAHFNGSTPLNISKLFLNKEGQFIGISQEALEDKYTDIRKNSVSLADWLKKSYELKATNITTMDIMTASYAIAMEEAKQNCRYLEIRIDPFSSSFVGSPEDIVKAVEVGLRNAHEDIKDQGKELKTGIIILAERHTSPDTSLKTAKFATKSRSQRLLFDQMYKEQKDSEAQGESYKSSKTLNNNYLELMKINKVLQQTEELTSTVYNSKSFDRRVINEQLNDLNNSYTQNIESGSNTEITKTAIDKVYKSITVSKTKSISTIDLAPAVYSIVMEKVKQGERDITISIDPTDNLFAGSPEDILRAVHVGLRNAKIDLENTIPIKTSIVIELDKKKLSEEEALKLANLAVKMKSQRELFNKMQGELDEALSKNRVFDRSKVLEEILADYSLMQSIKTKINALILTQCSTTEELKTSINRVIGEDLTKLTLPTAKTKAKSALSVFFAQIKQQELTPEYKNELKLCFENNFNKADKYINDKALLAEKIFDNLRHNSTLKLEDIQNNTKILDRYLRMGIGVIPNVVGLFVNTENNSNLKETLPTVNAYIQNYNKRKDATQNKLKLLQRPKPSIIKIKDLITKGQTCGGQILNQVEDLTDFEGKTFNSFDEGDLNPIYSKSKIIGDLSSLQNLLQNPNTPDQYLKLTMARGLKELNDKLDTQYKLQEQKFILARKIFSNLEHYSSLKMSDKKNKTKDAIIYARMGVNIIPKVVGFDIAGNENEYPLYLHNKALNHIKYYNESKTNPDDQLKVTVHAGEVKKSGDVAGWENINNAVQHGVHRIGHGIDLRNAPQSLKDEVKLRNITIETCPKSNFQSKAVDGYRNHPILDFLDEDLPATINTDNPVTSGTNLTNEFVKIFKRFNWNISPEEKAKGINERLTMGHVKKLIHNAIWGAFALSAQEKVEEEQYAMKAVEDIVHKYEDKIVLKDDEPIMLKVQKQVVAFTGNLRKAMMTQFGDKRAA